ncbi:helix-turn-helix domain-containing protein [Listeria booriae]|uniref:HTH domain-containing protein n=1 Tax=Listeria booriae TaxID=1552123 RepID=A0A7X1BVZ1_9LIST|nr:helix-turn-helix domain-containing protein [Listeria booriae]MBC1227108.1 HTH domain-containing protein [Listeria booriae]MBC1230800.1 HTH domain-containing protein [Listeria booriae]MBC1234813.1 HTH domain-containing protein [Listeria booriae]MBC1247146.1 HTH domain-containing protein [Listeria booriae]MBC1271166.1 HTH domain-containing protein [Listeria booriae]
MKNTISSSDYRKLKLLNYLFNNEDNILKKDLAQKLSLSLVTLNTYVDEINEELSDFIRITRRDGRYFLDRRQDVNFDSLTAYMITHSFSYEIILATLRDEKKDVKNWLESMPISQSAFYRKLQEFDNLLARSNLILERSPVSIVGNELNIRFFYSHVLVKAYPESGWVINDIDYRILERFIKHMERELGIYFSPSALKDYAVSLAVLLTRIKQGHFVQFDEYQAKYWEDAARYYDIKNFDFSLIQDVIGVPIPENELHILFIAQFLVPFSYYDKQKVLDRLSHKKEVLYVKPFRVLAEKIVDEIFKDKQYDIEMLKIYLINYFVRFVFVSKTTHLLDIDYFSRKITPVTYEKKEIERHVSQLIRESGLTMLRDNKGIIVQYIFDLFNVYMMDKHQKKQLRIKVVAKNGSVWEEYLKDVIQKQFPPGLITFANELDSKEHLPRYDLIISDYPIDNYYGCPLLAWHFPPTKKELEELSQFLDEMQRK